MNTTIPVSVVRYLRTLDPQPRAFAYCRLDTEHRVTLVGGEVDLFGFELIDTKSSVITQYDALEGLLPSGEDPVVILNTQTVTDQFFDLHLFMDMQDQWIVFLDSTEQAKDLQASQQERLNQEFLEEQRRLSKR